MLYLSYYLSVHGHILLFDQLTSSVGMRNDFYRQYIFNIWHEIKQEEQQEKKCMRLPFINRLSSVPKPFIALKINNLKEQKIKSYLNLNTTLYNDLAASSAWWSIYCVFCLLKQIVSINLNVYSIKWLKENLKISCIIIYKIE